jgi:capsular polysaccharide biosynthesis protein
MSHQSMDLRKILQILRRYKILLAALAIVGILVGGAYAVLKPPLVSSQALVVIPQANPGIATDVVIVTSEPVLSGALPSIQPAMSLQTLENQVHAESLTSGVLSITADGSSAAQAESAANAVAASFVHYVGTKNSPVGNVSAHSLQTATTASGSSPAKRDITYGALGGVVGLIAGVIAALVIARRDRKLRALGDIANSIGVPVLAAVQADHPSDAAGWTKFLDEYQPGPVVAWRLRQALRLLGADPEAPDREHHGDMSAITVLSLSSDPDALVLGPQLAVHAARCGIPTALVIGPQQDTNVAAALRAASAVATGSTNRPRHLRTVVADGTPAGSPPSAALTVIVMVVDGASPGIPIKVPTSAAVLGVSAGGATTEQLARVATSAAAVGYEVLGFLVADPESSDDTNGRFPGPRRPARRASAPLNHSNVASESMGL